MQGFVLDSKEPLYGRADEIVKMQPLAPAFVTQALHCDAEQAVREYAVWGGVPRYWELRKNSVETISALMALTAFYTRWHPAGGEVITMQKKDSIFP